ncbi:MAG: 2-C-methyl-D-erythritol 4-phosphate cytidylyltransferase [Actinomycetota bacterium]
MSTRVAALVTAAGSGTRFGGQKQFITIDDAGTRLVDRAVVTMRAVADWVGVILPADHEWSGPAVDAALAGGHDRRSTIAAGMAFVPAEAEIVVVHSASHPLASAALAQAAIDALGHGSGADGAVPTLPLVDVAKRVGADGRLLTVGRQGFGLAQSPMAFTHDALAQALAADLDAVEESQLVEATGGVVVAVPGEVANVHVVDQASLRVVRSIAAFEALEGTN